MTLIALESSTLRPSVAAWHAGRCLQAWLATDRSHASDLLPSLSALLRRLERTPTNVTRIVVGRGPGSYTGLRVAAATALGFARGTGAALAGLSSFEALAWRELKPGERCAVLLDARASEAYWAVLARDADDVHFESEPAVARVEDVARRLPGDVPILSTAGIEKNVRLDAEQIARLRVDAVPQASALLELALTRGDRLGSDIEPLYLRAFAVKSRRA